MAKIDTLVDDIYTTVDQGVDTIEAGLISDFVVGLVNSLKRQLLKSERNRPSYLRVSNMGHPPRKLWYELNSAYEGEKLEPHVRLKFLFGDIIEELALLLVQMAGHEVTDRQKEVDINGIKGHMDCKIDGEVTDVKSAAARAFIKFVDNSLFKDDPFGYIPQLSGYVKHEKQDKGNFLAFNKESGKLSLMAVDNMELIDPYAKADEMKKVISLDTPPVRCYDDVEDGKSGNRKLNVTCSYCPYKEPCWADANNGQGLRLFLYSTGPRWLTNVEREPDVIEKKKETTNG